MIGASERGNSVGSVIFRNILDSGYKGRLYPINPKHESIHGIAAYKSIEDIGARVELAVIATKPKQCPRSSSSAGAAASGTSSSFPPVLNPGHTGAALERKTMETACSYGVRVLGPNCLGIARKWPQRDLCPRHRQREWQPRAGLPTGAICSAVLDWAASNKVGFSSVISLGSMADVDFGEILDYPVYDNRSYYILLYIEGIRNSRRFMSALRSAARIKPDHPCSRLAATPPARPPCRCIRGCSPARTSSSMRRSGAQAWCA